MPPPGPIEPTPVVLVDDHALVRRGLRHLFEREADFAVCGEATTEAEAFDLAEALAPGLLITDLTLEGRGGLDLIKRLSRYHPRLPVLVVSMHDERLYAQRALAAGARGYVMKGSAAGEVLRASRAVRDGHFYVAGEPHVERPADLPVRSTGTPLHGGFDPAAQLTDRELDVFLLLGQGFSPRHIAEKLSLSTSTIEVYREQLKEKLGLASSPLLLRYAIRWCKDQQVS